MKYLLEQFDDILEKVDFKSRSSHITSTRIIVRKRLEQAQKMMGQEKSRDAAKMLVQATGAMLDLLGDVVGMDDRIGYLKKNAQSAKSLVIEIGKDL